MENTITLTNQSNLFISGVEKVINVCATEVVVEVNGKRLCALGENMEIQRLDLENKILIVEGFVHQVKFAAPKKGFVKRIFK